MKLPSNIPSLNYCIVSHLVKSGIIASPTKFFDTPYAGPQKDKRRPRAKLSSTGPPPPPTFRLWPMRQKEFHSGLRPLRHFEEFLRIMPLQSEASQSTRPWGNLSPLHTPLSVGQPICTHFYYFCMHLYPVEVESYNILGNHPRRYEEHLLKHCKFQLQLV